MNIYRPQLSCGQGYVFTRVCDSVHRGGLRRTPPGTRQTPLGTRQTPPPDQGEPPRTRQTPPRKNPPPPCPDQADPTPTPDQADTPLGPRRTPPPQEEDCSIRSMSGRYASYWNAFLCFCQYARLKNPTTPTGRLTKLQDISLVSGSLERSHDELDSSYKGQGHQRSKSLGEPKKMAKQCKCSN